MSIKTFTSVFLALSLAFLISLTVVSTASADENVKIRAADASGVSTENVSDITAAKPGSLTAAGRISANI